MKVYLNRKENVLNVDDVFLTQYDVVSIVSSDVDVVAWDTEQSEGLKYFNEFAKVDGVHPAPEVFTDLSANWLAAVNHALAAYAASSNPQYFFRSVAEVVNGFEAKAGQIHIDNGYPQLTEPPAGYVTTVPPQATEFNGVVQVPEEVFGERTEGRYLQYDSVNDTFVQSAYDITKTLEEGRKEVITKVKKKVAAAINAELSIYSQVELVQAADINALAPAYASQSTIGEFVTAINAAVESILRSADEALTPESLMAVDPEIPSF